LHDDELASLERGGYLHDVGKIGIPDAVLQKPSKLTDQEYETMKRRVLQFPPRASDAPRHARDGSAPDRSRMEPRRIGRALGQT
jgi:hypothetical protein